MKTEQQRMTEIDQLIGAQKLLLKIQELLLAVGYKEYSPHEINKLIRLASSANETEIKNSANNE